MVDIAAYLMLRFLTWHKIEARATWAFFVESPGVLCPWSISASVSALPAGAASPVCYLSANQTKPGTCLPQTL